MIVRITERVGGKQQLVARMRGRIALGCPSFTRSETSADLADHVTV
ncbi:MAG: hypothetical protein ACLQUY_03585 [Ktedonobacterales bacterium]